MLDDDGVLGIEGAGLGEQGVGNGGLTQETGFAGLLDQLGDAMLPGDDKGEAVVGVAGVELLGLGELSLGGGEIVAVEEAGAFEVGVVGLLKLAFAEGRW